jgi:hypothetical protein
MFQSQTLTIKNKEYTITKQGQAKWTYLVELEGEKGAKYVLSLGESFATFFSITAKGTMTKGKKILLSEIA